MSYRDVINAHHPLVYRPLSGSTLSAAEVTDTPVFIENVTATSGGSAGIFLDAGSFSVGGWFMLYTSGINNVTPYNRRVVIGDSSGYFTISYGVTDALDSTPIMTATNFHGGTTTVGVNVPLYEPFHFATTWDGTNLKAYFNGQLKSVTAGSAPSSLGGIFGVGRMYGTSQGIEKIWGVGAWNTTLSDSDVLAWYNGAVPGTPRGYWPMNEGTGIICFDSSGGGRNLTINAPYRTTDPTTWSVVGTLDQSAPSLVPTIDGYSTYFDGNSANYVFGELWMEQGTGTARAPYTAEFWVKLDSAVPPATTLLSTGEGFSINRYLLDIKSLQVTTNNTLTNKFVCNSEIIPGQVFHVVFQDEHRSNLTNRPSKTWINGYPVGGTYGHTTDLSNAPSSTGVVFSDILIGQKAVTNQTTIVSGAGMIGHLQELALYRRQMDDNIVLQHYLAATDELQLQPTLSAVEPISTDRLVARFNKPVFLQKIDNVESPGLVFSNWKTYSNGDMVLDLFNKKPITYLKLDDVSSSLFADSSGNSNDATGYGTITHSSIGAVNKCIYLSSAADGYVDVPVNNIFQDNTSDWSVSLWANPASITSGMTICSNYSSSPARGWDLKTSSGNLIQVRAVYGESSGASGLAGQAPVGHWTMITVVFKAKNGGYLFEIWKNQELQSQFSTGSPLKLSPFTGVFRLGNSASSVVAGDRWDGGLDDLKVFDIALNEDDIKTLYRYGVAGRDTPVQDIIADGYTYTVQFDGYATDAFGQALLNNNANFDFYLKTEKIEDINIPVVIEEQDLTFINQNIGSQIKYYMRAYNTALLQYVYWSSNDEPDFTGASSGYSPAVLQDIVKIGQTA